MHVHVQTKYFDFRDHFDAEVRKWDQLPEILNEGNRKIVEVEGHGYKLLECIQKYYNLNTIYIIHPSK